MNIAPGILRNARAIEDLRPALLEIRGGINLLPLIGLGETIGSAMHRGSINEPDKNEEPGVAPTHLAMTI